MSWLWPWIRGRLLELAYIAMSSPLAFPIQKGKTCSGYSPPCLLYVFHLNSKKLPTCSLSFVNSTHKGNFERLKPKIGIMLIVVSTFLEAEGPPPPLACSVCEGSSIGRWWCHQAWSGPGHSSWLIWTIMPQRYFVVFTWSELVLYVEKAFLGVFVMHF